MSQVRVSVPDLVRLPRAAADYNTWLRSAAAEPFYQDLNYSQIWRSAQQGCRLHDVISSHFPFSGVLSTGVPANASAGAPYTSYDVLVAELPYVYV